MTGFSQPAGSATWTFGQATSSATTATGTISLPTDRPRVDATALAALAGAPDDGVDPLDLTQLSRMLHLSAGVVRTMQRPGEGSAAKPLTGQLLGDPCGYSVIHSVHWCTRILVKCELSMSLIESDTRAEVAKS